MKRKWVRILVWALSILAVIALLLGGLGIYTVRRSFPQVSGEIRLAGLEKPVDVYRDAYGIPHIYAATSHDLFFAQGYVHAQDRFWQMDAWRHIGAGRMAEMFGDGQLDTDRFLRTLGWARVAQKELETLDPTTKAYLQAYADGVNAYLADHQGSQLSLEYAVLGLINSDYRPEPWEPLNTLTWAKVMAWDLGGNLRNEIQRARLLKTLTLEQLAEIDPVYPDDHPYIVPGFKLSNQVSPAADQASAYALPAIASTLAQAQANLDGGYRGVLGQPDSGLGSNNWVIGGKLTSTGKPLLADDMHLGIQMPSIWYQVGLHCQPKGEACPVDVTGYSFAGAPGVVVGHNDRIAWGFTNVGPDVQDLFIEKINPQNPNQYEVNGQWQDMELVKETIQVAGAEPVELTVRYTRHGPVISDTYSGLEGFKDESGVTLPDEFVVALAWTALEPSRTFQSLLLLNQAGNWDEFLEAAALFDVPSQNLIYADVDGNIGYHTPGRIPMRAKGDGSLPVPGWNDEYAWTGYIPFDELPNTYNPPQGYIATANNAVAGPEYAHLITTDFDLGFRAERIVEMIETAPGPIDAAYIQTIHGDNKNLSAEFMVPLLLDLPAGDARQERARQLLANWDYQSHMDSAPAALYEVFWRNLLAVTFHDDLPERYWPTGNSRWFETVRQLADKPDSSWWDRSDTSEVENRDQMLALAFSQALDEIEKLQGSNPESWNWGDLHGAEFENQTLGQSGIAPIEALFNRGPYRSSGGSSLVNATGWNPLDPYHLVSVPSQRMIVDLSNLSASLALHTTGQSGHAYHPNYTSMIDPWRLIEYTPMLWGREQVEQNATDALLLTP